MVKRKTIEERIKQTKKKTNRDKLIQALKDNNFEFIASVIDCSICPHWGNFPECVKGNGCQKCIKLWLNQEVSDE